MASLKFGNACAIALLCGGLCFGAAATLREPVIAPDAFATDAGVSYCFGRVRGLDPGRLPQAYLVLRLHVTVAYRNAGASPLILPLERARTVYTGFKPKELSVFKEGLGLFDQAFKDMKYLPADVSPDSPVTPKNDVFTVIAAGGEMTPPLVEEVTLPVDRQGLFKKYPDLRGRRVYVELRFAHRKLSKALEADLSDRWSNFGIPWTGTLSTNTIAIDVPAAPQAGPCVDVPTPAHPAEGLDIGK